MRGAGGLIITTAVVLMTLSSAEVASAGPWTKKKGTGQVIVKVETMRAERGFTPDGDLVDLPAARRDDAVSVFAEYGLTDRLTVQFKGDWQSGEDAFVDYEGRGPLEIGLTWQVWRDEKTAISLYAGYADGGEGRNAGYAAPGQGEGDVEVRLSAGRSFTMGRKDAPRNAFVDVQVARRQRQGLPDETRMDLTYGVDFGRNWQLLNQIYAGQGDDSGPRWVTTESSVVRRFGDWSVQAGWRQTLAGRETPQTGGPVIGLWRRF